jgi:hypothetical protein
MPDFKLTTPVAFMIFNRPDTTERVFAEIARARPTKLLVVGDGARAGRQGESDKVAATRAIIGRVDWDCEVLTNFSDTNLGCKRRMSSGIDWIFNVVEEAIILEDDCVPHPSFFRFCEELLDFYRLDQRVSQINGINFQFGHQLNSDSYYFSKYCHIWGWASWRDRWKKHYDVDMKHWPRIRDDGGLANLVSCRAEEKYWTRIFEQTFQGKIDTWDYQWIFASMLHERLTILPNVNLVSNIGFGAAATHTSGSRELSNLRAHAMQFPLRHPREVLQCRTLDSRFFNRVLRVPMHRRLGNRLRQMVST